MDIIESCFIEANEKLKSENCEFKHEAKREFNLLLSHCRNLKRYVRNCSEETQEFFGKDSDMLYQALKLIIDRCGTDDVKLFKFFNYIKTFPSQLDMDIDDTVFNGVCKKIDLKIIGVCYGQIWIDRSELVFFRKPKT